MHSSITPPLILHLWVWVDAWWGWGPSLGSLGPFHGQFGLVWGSIRRPAGKWASLGSLGPFGGEMFDLGSFRGLQAVIIPKRFLPFLENRRSWENQKHPENRQKSGLFWASPFTMHLVCTLLIFSLDDKRPPRKPNWLTWAKSPIANR